MKEDLKKRFSELRELSISIYNYCISGVWSDMRRTTLVNIIKTINLAISSFLDKKFQQKAAALTYSTLLAIIPALALLFAIGRGFGFQNLLQSELFKYFPAQKEVLIKSFSFVDSYLEQSSQGVFLGIGIIFLLWTLISLIMNVEDVFNKIWGVRQGRSFYRKLTDYTAMFLILPILMICEGGISIFMAAMSNSATLFSPIMKLVLDILPLILTWLFFTASFILVPNTKVKFKYTIIPGIICGSAFQLLQWLFVSGQVYVSKYNAIYGSFAFLPLLLIWVQLTWIITLGGVGLSYSSQNFFSFNFKQHIKDISTRYFNETAIIIMALIIDNFKNEKEPYSERDLSMEYELPIKLVNKVIMALYDAKLIVVLKENAEGYNTYIPALDINKIDMNLFFSRMNNCGESDFLKEFDSKFVATIKFIKEKHNQTHDKEFGNVLLKDIPVC